MKLSTLSLSFLSIFCLSLFSVSADAATKASQSQEKRAKQQAADRRTASMEAKLEKDALKEVRPLMYDGMTYKELEKKVSIFEYSRWNTSEYGVTPLSFNIPSLRCAGPMAAPMLLYPHSQNVSWEYDNVIIPNTLPVSFSCAQRKKWNGVNFRFIDSKLEVFGKDTYVWRRAYRAFPAKVLIDREVSKDKFEVYVGAYQPTHKWNAFEFQSGYMFSGLLDGFFDAAQTNRRLSEYYLSMRSLFKMDVGQCIVSHITLEEEPSSYFDAFFGITSTTEECAKKFQELYDTGRVDGFKRIRQIRRDEDEFAVQTDSWFEKFQLKDRHMLDFYTSLSKDVKIDRNLKLFEYLKCRGVRDNTELNKYVDKYAAKSSCVSADKILEKNLSEYYLNKEILRFVYYYSQANQAEKGKHCFYPKVFSTKLISSHRKVVKDIPGSNVFCATDDELEDTLQASYASLKNQFSGYSTEFPIFVPIGFLKSKLTNMDGIVFPEIGNLGPKSTISQTGAFDKSDD